MTVFVGKAEPALVKGCPPTALPALGGPHWGSRCDCPGWLGRGRRVALALAQQHLVAASESEGSTVERRFPTFNDRQERKPSCFCLPHYLEFFVVVVAVFFQTGKKINF